MTHCEVRTLNECGPCCPAAFDVALHPIDPPIAMTEEEFERLKAAEKDHLRAKKKLQATLQSLRQKKQVRSAVDRLARSAQQALDRASELIGQLARETARGEARLDVVLDHDADSSPDESELAAFEEDRRADQAHDLVRQMKQAQRIPSASRSTPPSSTDDAASEEPSEDGATSSGIDRSTSSTRDDLPEKTIGRMR